MRYILLAARNSRIARDLYNLPGNTGARARVRQGRDAFGLMIYDLRLMIEGDTVQRESPAGFPTGLGIQETVKPAAIVPDFHPGPKKRPRTSK